MIEWPNSEPRYHLDEFETFIAVEVERALARRAPSRKTSISAGKIAGGVAAAVALLPPVHLRAIEDMQDDLPRLAAEFVQSLAAKAMLRLEMNIGSRPSDPPAAPPTVGPRQILQSLPDQRDVLDTMSFEDWAGHVVGQTYLEAQLHIPRSTLHLWRRHNAVIALRAGSRKHVFPLAQFVDGRPVPGIRDVLSHIANPRQAWFWLNNPSPCLDGRIPVALLRQELVTEVVSALRRTSSS
ncbi:MAG: hypothetical protein E5X89_25800 [Mesorhizobium sp.]|nr:hypothetical protein [Mesorhizobium sp.]TIO30958.1 MAG: hypothetical protein E5X89_25800 [Mesorhizobium sp.]